MLTTIFVVVVLLTLIAEVVRGFVQRRHGGEKDAMLALGAAVACVSYLIRDHVSEFFLLAFLLIGLAVAWGGFLVVSRRGLRNGFGPTRSNSEGGSKWLFWILAVLAADILAVILIVSAIGNPLFVILSFVAVNLIGVALSRRAFLVARSQNGK